MTFYRWLAYGAGGPASLAYSTTFYVDFQLARIDHAPRYDIGPSVGTNVVHKPRRYPHCFRLLATLVRIEEESKRSKVIQQQI